MPETRKQTIDRLTRQAKENEQFADRTMDGDDNYDGADGARAVLEMCDLFNSMKALAATFHTNPTPNSWTAWLIEHGKLCPDGPRYLTQEGEELFSWTLDPLKAIHFVRREDADRIAFGEDCGSIQEHEFVGAEPKE